MELYPQQDLLTEETLIVQYAGFWPRLWAILLDALILAVLAPITYFNKTYWKSIPVLVILFLIQMTYKSFFEYKYGATPGKMALGIRVVNYEFERPSLAEVLLRNLFQLSSVAVYMILSVYFFNQPLYNQTTYNENVLSQYSSTGSYYECILIFNLIILAIYTIDFIFLISNDERRSLHDRIGKTYVIKNL
jgi:uncharacterized RDD family membrane protein YckC